MQRLVRLTLFTLIAVAVLGVGAWLLREPLLSAVGISFDSGEPGETALVLADGYEASVFTSGLENPRFMAVAPDGTLVVAEAGQNRVVALPDRDGDGRADEHIVVGSDYDVAHSVAFAHDGSLLVAGSGTLFRVTLDDQFGEISREVVLEYVPSGQHSTRTVAVAPGWLAAGERRLQLQRLLGDRRGTRDHHHRAARGWQLARAHAGPAQRRRRRLRSGHGRGLGHQQRPRHAR